jgi:hypothetical protein
METLEAHCQEDKISTNRRKSDTNNSWDSQEPFFEHYQELTIMISNTPSSEMLRNKRQSQMSQIGVLLHDISPPHTAVHGVKMRFKFLEYPPYSPDLAPSDYPLFGSLKNPSRGHRFASFSEQKMVHKCFASWPNIFLLRCI